MKQIFVELFNFKDAWRELPSAARQEYAAAVLAAVNRQSGDGVQVISWSFNDAATDRRAPYDFICVYVTPSEEYQRRFEAEICGAGWYGYFDQVNASGAVSTPEALADAYVRLDHAAAEPA